MKKKRRKGRKKEGRRRVYTYNIYVSIQGTNGIFILMISTIIFIFIIATRWFKKSHFFYLFFALKNNVVEKKYERWRKSYKKISLKRTWGCGDWLDPRSFKVPVQFGLFSSAPFIPFFDFTCKSIFFMLNKIIITFFIKYSCLIRYR